MPHGSVAASLVLAVVALSLAGFALAQDKPAEERKLLADHQTVAKFDGLKQRTCRGPGGSGSCPERPVVKLEKIAQDEAEKLIKAGEAPGEP